MTQSRHEGEVTQSRREGEVTSHGARGEVTQSRREREVTQSRREGEVTQSRREPRPPPLVPCPQSRLPAVPPHDCVRAPTAAAVRVCPFASTRAPTSGPNGEAAPEAGGDAGRGRGGGALTCR